MKTKLGLLVLAALLLLSGCDAIFDTLIEAVYKDQIDENKFGEVEVPVTITIGGGWIETDRTDPLKLALVPYYEASGGIIPDWGGRIERVLDWNGDLINDGYPDARFETSFSVQKGFASWRLIVWQPRSDDDSRIKNTDPSKVLFFKFVKAWGSNEVLDDYNLDSGPYVADSFIPSDRAPSGIIDPLYDADSGEAMNIYGPQSIDAAQAASEGTYTFSIWRYSSATYNRVREIRVRRLDDVGTLVRRTWEGEWLVFSVPDGEEYNSYYEFVLGFDGLYENGDESFIFNPGPTEPVWIEAQLVYEDGSLLPASPPTMSINFYTPTSYEIAPGTPFSVKLTVNRSDDSGYFSKLAWLILYDENWNFLLQVPEFLNSSGQISFSDFRGYPSYSGIQGGRYKLRVIVDTNGDTVASGYHDGAYYDYDQYADAEVVVTTDGDSYYDGEYGTVYIGEVIFDAGATWSQWGGS